ncbi:Uncharacterised protein [Mycobacterium tuberculosis]|uniref:Uncharacterized protein n=1 Tax=Mycobacterium tuberculosis TaxID=1773 RepID=A0A0T9BX40_MYCTX|nr:Uncharacterised protein [Mycobacterium tuberculosis]CKR24410.1 Uncharacterised protein [Mycobacterium tuberculosis]CKR65436.1 Uncharacterised protein [Mycobacterium tuberculosis]CKT02555.1 Uncharacterised protein [Mycobacterium tuberculosis]CKX22038.1 Uncharacterised protein [Mycobacterium tuberculosis]
MTFTPGASKPLSAVIKAALAASSGKSPIRVTVLPLRLIDSKDKDNAEAPRVLVGVSVGNTPVGPVTDWGRSNAP